MPRAEHHNAKEGAMGIWECQEHTIIMLKKVFNGQEMTFGGFINQTSVQMSLFLTLL